MGAVPGSRVLTGPSPASWFDVESFRSSSRRVVVVRRTGRAALVLGSTQPATVVDPARAARAGTRVVRRRSGGGAVLVGPGDPVWIDLWLPRGDPLWRDDVVHAPGWVGEWWASVLRDAGAAGVAVHRGGSVAGPWSDLICFAGVGPGEVLAGGHKVVGVAQWRSREGALFHSCAYRRWDPRPLVELLDVPDADRDAMAGELSSVAVGLEALAGPLFRVESLLDGLPPGPAWDISAP